VSDATHRSSIPEPNPDHNSASRPDPNSASGPDQKPGAGPDAGPDGRAGDGTDPSPPPRRGADLARAVLDAAKARPPAKRRKPTARAAGAAGARKGWSGSGPDPRDPQPFGSVLDKLVKARGWQRPAAEATVFGQWERVVGPEVAEHCRPVKLVEGELTIEAASTAWATQLRLLAGSLLKQIAGQIGHNVVTKLRIHGPAAPTWNRGPRRVRGRGPRDTYG
jgi:predicted nucleic acid-binding Zn ribbon protein